MRFDSAPGDASVENLLELCEVFREGDLSRKELYEAVDQGETLVRDNIRYGVGLGFLEESEEGVSATSRGIEASYNKDDPEELAEQFQAGFRDYRLYNVVLEDLVDDGVAQKGEITKSDVLQVFRTSVGLEGSENTLGSAATTFINTLEAAGLGNYIVGRGGKETRVELDEEFEVLVEQVIEDDQAEEEANRQGVPEGDQGGVDYSDQATAENIKRQASEPDSSFQIRLELSGEEDPTKVEKLIVGIRRGLAQEIDVSDVNPTSENSVGEIEDSQDGPEREIKSSKDQDQGEAEEEDDESSDSSLDTFMNSKSEPPKE
ncbi:hypothetical protein [Halopenitus sp. POP-27]|uniref:hypothetical protein n=1 Tax=Halopenitus sp. POP-27 TaxID=2994425 RepID=UPI00246995F8|nr:hypothetical protein [Halopenitus sp. POP-27]